MPVAACRSARPPSGQAAGTEAHAIGARLVLDLDHLGTQRREVTSRAGAGEHPAEIDDTDAGKREGLACGACLGRPAGQAAIGRQRRHLSRRRPLLDDRTRVLAQSGRPLRRYRPGCIGTVPASSNIGVRSPLSGCGTLAKTASLNVVRIAGILLGPPHGRPRQPVVLARHATGRRRNPGWPQGDRPACRPWPPFLHPAGPACRGLRPFRAWQEPRWFPDSASEE